MAAPSSHTPTIALGLIAAPGFATELASELADDLSAALAGQVCAEITWEVPVVSDPLVAEATRGTAMIDAGRERMVCEGWDLAVVLTDVPLRIRRPARRGRCQRDPWRRPRVAADARGGPAATAGA